MAERKAVKPEVYAELFFGGSKVAELFPGVVSWPAGSGLKVTCEKAEPAADTMAAQLKRCLVDGGKRIDELHHTLRDVLANPDVEVALRDASPGLLARAWKAIGR